MPSPVLIVFSHVRWGFVVQRPQHLLSRLAARWRVLFVEEPVLCDGPAHLQVREPVPSLSVIVPHTPVPSPGFHDDQIARIAPLLERYLDQQGLRTDVAWLCTPMAQPLLATVDASCVVYDCMDGLSALAGAPLQLQQRESALMAQAALVLAGGPSLYAARHNLHANVHCFPSAVDVGHFAPGGLAANGPHHRAARSLQAGLPRPRAGYFGVVDERLDLDLLAMVADAHTEWSVVVAGPVVGIDPASLPRRPNVHWLGMQPHERLPHLLADWDLCMMPFAINESTRFIGPTQTLEYMAGEKPVVSTAVPDVISLYGSVVAVAHSPTDFVRAAEALMRETRAERASRAIEMLQTVSMYSWDRSAANVDTLLQAALANAQALQATTTSRSGSAVPAWARPGAAGTRSRAAAGGR